MKSPIAEALKKIRLRTGLSQQKLADKLEVTKPTVSRCESRNANPSWTTIERFLRGCGANVRDLALGIDDEPQRVMVADGREVLEGEIETAEEGVQMRVDGNVLLRAQSTRELLELLPKEVSVYGLIR